MVKHYGFLFLLLFCTKMTAQYTDVINSNRPGFSESPFAVGLGIVQIEGGFTHQLYKNRATNKRLATNQFMQTVRMGAFFERLEWSGFAFQDNNYFYTDPFEQRRAGASIGFGIKYLLYHHDYKKPKEIRSWKKKNAFDWKRIIPSIGIATSASFYTAPKLNSKDPNLPKDLLFQPTPLFSFTNTHTPESTSNSSFLGRIALLFHNDLNDNWALTTNVVYNKTYDRQDQYAIALSSNYVLSNRWGVFGETRQVLRPEHTAEASVGTAFLANQDLQFDVTIHGGVTELDRSIGFSIGASYRFDKHIDRYKIIEIDGAGNKIIPPKSPPFFTRAGLFFKTIPQKTKELVTVGILSTGDFFRELFKKKKRPKKKRKVKTLRKPSRGVNLLKEQNNRDLLRNEKTTPADNITKPETETPTQNE